SDGYSNVNGISRSRDMKAKKIVSLISAISVLVIGIAIIILAVIDVKLPMPLWTVFGVCDLINAVMLITNFKQKDQGRR
ncbi:MAG: hypothetical protein II936_02655, partial [Oscillospiraceae bacterium]|nr:hypothetical protein [Oscillospiraceae bacterium]